MDQPTSSGPQYFISMTDMLLGLLIIFLVIVGYLAVSFSLSIEKAMQADEAMNRAEEAEARIVEARKQYEDALERVAIAEDQAREAENKFAAAAKQMAVANARAEEAEQRADQLQNILISIDKTRVEILEAIKARLAASNFNVEIDEKSGVVRLPEAELFQTGKFELTEEGRQNIEILRAALEGILPCYSSSKNIYVTIQRLGICADTSNNLVDAFFVEGHADSQPVKSNILFKDNQELSTKRAMTAYNLLAGSELLSKLTNSNDEFIMSVSGYGANRPLCMEQTKACFSKNRRIDLRLVMEIPKRFENIKARTDVD